MPVFEDEKCINDGSISQSQIEKYLTTSVLGKKIYVFDCIDSTNSYAKKLAADGVEDGALIVANQQSAGRGRLGRSFFSPKGAGVYFSLLLRPKTGINEALLITSAISVAVCRAIDTLAQVKTEIKWVNDIYLGGKKLCGILTEAASGSNSRGVDYVVAGVGINVTNDAFPDEIKDIATSISAHSDVKVERDKLIAAVINEFEKIYNDIENRMFMQEYKARSCVIGKSVYAIRAGVSREVFVDDIDDDGALVVTNENGEAEHINTGEISIRFI